MQRGYMEARGGTFRLNEGSGLGSEPQNPRDLRTHILRLLGPETILAFGLV